MINLKCVCGEVYHADEKFIGQNIKCRVCDRILKIEVAEPATLKVTEQFTSPPISTKPQQATVKDKSSSSNIATVFVLFILVVSVVIFFSVRSSKKTIPPSVEVQQALNNFSEDEMPLVSISKDAVEGNEEKHTNENYYRLPLGASPLGKGIHKGHSTITVDNGNSIDAFCKLTSTDKRKMFRNFFLPMNKKYKAKQIPPGEYILCVAFGSEWDTLTNKNFRYNTGCTQTEKFSVTETSNDNGIEYSNIMMTLHLVSNGNFSSSKLSAEEFEAIK